MKNNKSTSRNHSPTKNPINSLLQIPIAYENLEKQIEEYGIPETIKGMKESLVRLTKQYDGENLEKIITWIIKEKIFVYVFCPERQPLSTSSQKCNAEWHALTSCQASVIFSHPINKIELFHNHAFGIHDLWVNKLDADKLLFIITEANTKLRQIADAVTNKFWLNLDLNQKNLPKATEIKKWIEDSYGVTGNEAAAVDKICRPQYAKLGGTKPLKIT